MYDSDADLDRWGLLWVSNHLSYLDIGAYASLRPVVFVTSQDLRADPVLGTLAALGGSVFVNRKSPRSLRSEIANLAGLVKEGYTVMIFPEATSSDGERVLPFKPALFEAAVAAGRPVQMSAIRYSLESAGEDPRQGVGRAEEAEGAVAGDLAVDHGQVLGDPRRLVEADVDVLEKP